MTRRFRGAMALVMTTALAACGAAPTTTPTPGAVARGAASADPLAGSNPPAAASSAATPPDASPEKWTELEASPGAVELEPGAEAIRRSDWSKAKALLDPALAKIRPAAQVDEIMAGEALLGRACAALKNTPCAEKAFASILAAWKSTDTVAELRGNGSEEAATARVHRALLAVGEALYFEGEKKRVAADGIPFPSYTGSGTRDSVSQFVTDKVAPWVKQKRAAIDEADDAYAKIARLEPAAPPRWVVDGASRVGEMKARFVAQFRAAPIPNEWHHNGPVPWWPGRTYDDVRSAYYGALDSASEPLKLEAKAAFEACQSTSKKFDYVDDFSKHCDLWLEKNYPVPG